MRAIPRRAVVAWVLYDLANTIFSMGVVSLYFSFYVRDAVGVDRADAVYGVITAVSMGAIFVLSPLLGAMTDRARRRMPFLVWSTVICCTCTALLARGPFAISAVLFVVANAAYQAGLQFYDALLPEVTTEENRGRIGGIGVGVGYLGSYLAVGLGFFLDADQRALLFGSIALLFLGFALPCFLFVGERGNPSPRPVFGWRVIRESTAETLRALRSGHEYPGLLRFLVGRVFYTDAINTVIAFMSLYTVNVAVGTGLTQDDGESRAQLVLMSAISFAIVGGLVWGWVTDRVGPQRTLRLVLLLWMATFALAFLLFALPCFLFVREPRDRPRRQVFGWRVIRESTAETIRTLRSGREYPGLLRFLVGRVFYTDAINTVIGFMALYALNVAAAAGLEPDAASFAKDMIMLGAISCAVPAGFVWGRIADRIGPKRTLDAVLYLWMGTFVLAAAVGAFELSLGWLALVACLAGVGLAGTWSADRPYMLRLAPPHRIGEFYGLYGMVGRFSAITGPALWGLTTFLLVQQSGLPVLMGEAAAILVLLAIIVIGYVILRPVSDAPRHWGGDPLRQP